MIRPLKNKALQVKMVQIDSPHDAAEDNTIQLPTMDPTEINDLLKDQVQNLGKTILVVAAGMTALATLREVIVNNTNPANR